MSEPTSYNSLYTKRLWEQFCLGKEISLEALPSHVYKSWLNCRALGLGPSDIPEPKRLNPADLNSIKKEYQDLLDIAVPVLNMIRISTSETQPIVILTLESGVIIHIAGDERSLSAQEAFYNAPGVVCDEKIMGARATTIALKEGRPLSLCGCEHYLEIFHESLCYAAPIFDHKQNIVASISIATSLKKYHPHTMAMLTAAAENVSMQLQKMDWDYKKNYLSSLIYSICNTLPEGIVALDMDKNITYVNEAAEDLLGGSSGRLIGKHINGFIHNSSRKELMEALSQQKRSHIPIHLSGTSVENKYLCRIQPLNNDNQDMIGTTLFLASDKQVLKGINHMGGSRAYYQFDDILGESPKIKRSIELARKIAKQANRILITGESGTGKELFAQAVHNAGPRRSGPFVAISCASIPRELVEAELFGYVPGAFTGAHKSGALGKFELAQNGTIFLDEINSLPMEAQGKLLRALQQNEFIKVGGTTPVHFEATIIAATNVSLPEMVSSKLFRQDLLYRINSVEIEIPPLRERTGDIEILIEYFIAKQARSQGRQISMTPLWKNAMLAHNWVGNVRELENACEYSLIVSESGILQTKHLHPSLNVKRSKARPFSHPIEPEGSLNDTYKKCLIQTLDSCGGNLSDTAKRLGISRSTLYRKLKKYDISPEA